MNILIVTDSYPPEIRSSSNLMYELALGLKKRGHIVTVLTTYPRYSLAADNVNHSYDPDSSEDEIRVIRIKTPPIHNVNFILRGFAQLSLLFLCRRAAVTRIKDDIDVIFVYSPPLPLCIVGSWLKNKFHARLILNVQDIFPQNAIDLGIMKNRFIIRFFGWMEQYAYRHADTIVVHSQSNKAFLTTRKDVSSQKVKVVHNWVDINAFNNAKPDKTFRREYGLESKFVVLFAGVFGPSQGLETIIDAAGLLKENGNIVFLFVGNGSERKKLMARVEREKLQNVVFVPFVAKDRYPALVKSVDVGLVSLSSKNKTPAVPGKMVGYMAGGIPILASLQEQSDGHEMVRRTGCGISVVSGDLKAFLEALHSIKDNPGLRMEMGRRGRKFVEENLRVEIILNEYEKLFG